MKLTTEWLTEQHACQSGMYWFKVQTETDGILVAKKLMGDIRIGPTGCCVG